MLDQNEEGVGDFGGHRQQFAAAGNHAVHGIEVVAQESINLFHGHPGRIVAN